MTTPVSRSHDLSERLVRHVAARAPAALRERLKEEWLADLQTRDGLRSKLCFALGCAWASRVIAIEQRGLMLVSAGQDRAGVDTHTSDGLTRQASSMLLVVALHVALFYAGWSSLQLIHRPRPPGPIQYTPIPQPIKAPFRPDDGVNLDPVRVRVPAAPVHPSITSEPDAPRGVREADAGSGSDLEPVDLPRTSQRVPGAPAAGFPNVNDYYPARSIRAGETGVTAVQVCVNAHGRLQADPTTVQSSGFANLDAAALRLAKSGSGHYRPTTVDGAPVAACFAYAVRFRLDNVR